MKKFTITLPSQSMNALHAAKAALDIQWDELITLLLHLLLQSNVLHVDAHRNLYDLLEASRTESDSNDFIDPTPKPTKSLHYLLPSIDSKISLLNDQMGLLVSALTQMHAANLSAFRAEILENVMHIRVDLDTLDETTSFDSFIRLIIQRVTDIPHKYTLTNEEYALLNVHQSSPDRATFRPV